MELILASVLAFASTNVDDLFILALFFGSTRNSKRNIYFGQYLGIISLVGISLAGALIGSFVDSQYVGLLGLFPFYLGLKQLYEVTVVRQHNDSTKTEVPEKITPGMFSIMAVTIANGGDNIGTYIPLFTTLTIFEKLMMIGIFLVMVFIWLVGAEYLAKNPLLKNVIARYGHWITPVVLCMLGLYILNENGSFALLGF